MRDRRRLIVCLGLMALASAAFAEETASAGVDTHKLLSARTSELIRAELPRYTPAPPAEEEVEFASTTAEMKDDTLYLPKLTVRQVMKAPLQSSDWFTPSGRMDFALKRFPGTRIGNFFGLNNPWAWARLTEDIEAERHEALKETGRSVLVDDTGEDKENRRLLKAALMYSGRPPPN